MESRVAVDLEADSLHNYREKVCLIQISAAARTAILDPLSDPGILPSLAPSSPTGVVKVFHGGDYDVRLLGREGIHVRSLFDTMIAAQLAGRSASALRPCSRRSSASSSTSATSGRTGPGDRSTPAMLAYAAADTAHLLALADRLSAELERLGVLAGPGRNFFSSSRSSPPRRRPHPASVSRAPAGSRRASSRGCRRFSSCARNWRAPGTARPSRSFRIRSSSTGRCVRRRTGAM